ncbi:PP2C family serine/threonine-protein phosphatase [Candidatus Uabimicrobium sp. HlEnr_7]|uniref:PP2C family protein-serine/threonine phosphatase n=1 Tax=Candidatus Uabimicrobium helgolandensis TaxID=3095367 RepID=UPI003557191E
MPLLLRGKLKDTLEILWDFPCERITVCSNKDKQIILYSLDVEKQNKINIRLEDLNFSQITEKELEIIAIAADIVSQPIKIQKCPHDDCNLWGHVKDDGYCKHCGRRVKKHLYTTGFPKLGISCINVTLSDGEQGTLWKSKEQHEHDNSVYSVGLYQAGDSPKKNVDILEEQFSEEVNVKFLQLYKILENSDLLNQYWQPPLVSFQKDFNRILWIYQKLKENEFPSISAYDYITSKVNEPLTTKEIIGIGIQLCIIARTIYSYNQHWCSLRLADLVLQRKPKTKYPVTIYLRTRDISWQENPSQKLVDNSLIPWELYWDDSSGKRITQTSEVYIIAAALYLLKAKSPNLLQYNPISYHYGLPSLKLFKADNDLSSIKNVQDKYFESILNQALVSHPEERGYQKIKYFQDALESLYLTSESDNEKFTLEIGSDLDVGDEKHKSDFTKNQDSLFVTQHTLTQNGWGLFVLCDGISTCSFGSGADASQITTDTFREWWQNNDEKRREEVCAYASDNQQQGCNFLSSLVNTANSKIRKKVIEHTGNVDFSSIMGSTVTAGLVHKDMILFSWVGDSPIFRFSKYGWERLNFEDNERNIKILSGRPLEEAFIDGGNAITRCIGANYYDKAHVDMHFAHTYLSANENLLICSDGIPDYIEPESDLSLQENYRMMRLASIFSSYNGDSLVNAKALSSILISSANRISGGKDNLSAIVLRTLPKSFQPKIESYNRLRLLSFVRQKKLQRANADETAKVTRRLSITQDID